jgi:hypothetical protein
MRLAIHIFKKDVRRLWWEITVATAALAYLSHLDANRMDRMTGPTEGLMNLVVPGTWAFLIAMLVHQEALVGDRHFWLTRPYPRASLVLAKLLFIVCFIHVPSFLFDMAVVGARGFDPFFHLTTLLGKQLMQAVALSIPVLALAAVTRNLAQFASAGLICFIGGYLLTSPPWGWGPPLMLDRVRIDVILLLLFFGGAAAIVIQYARRRVLLSRLIAGTAFASAVLFTAYVPRNYTTGLACRGGPAMSIATSQRNTMPPDYLRHFDPSTSTVSIPVTVSGLARSAAVFFEPLEFDIEGARGGRWSMEPFPVLPRPPIKRSPIRPLLVMAEGTQDGWLVLTIDGKLFGAMAAQPATLRGRFSGNVLIPGERSQIAIATENAYLAGLGRCASFIVENTFSMYRDDLLKAVCESPERIPSTYVEFVQPASGFRVQEMLGASMLHVSYPSQTWLSPVNRMTAFFHIVDGPLQPGDRWRVPRSAMSGGRIEFLPRSAAGCSNVEVVFEAIDLRKYLLFPEG